MRLTDFESRRVDELSPATLASYKTKAGAAATAADAAGDVKTADRRFSGIVKATKKQFGQDAKGMSEDSTNTVYSGAEDLSIGDPVIITGKGIEFEGTTGEISDFGDMKRFVVVNLYNHGPHSFHSSDVSFNEYAGSDEEEARMYDTDPDARAHGVNEQGMAEATDPTRAKLERMIWKYFGQIYNYGDDDGLNYLDLQGDLWNQLMDKYNGEIEDIVAQEPIEVLMQAAQELKGIADDMKYELDEAAQGHTIEAHGVRGMDRRTWHKTFRNTDQMIAWAEKYDAEIIGTRDLEQAQRGNLSPAQQGRQIDEVFADQGSGSTDRDNAEYMKRRRAAKNTATRGSVTKKPQPYNDPNWIDKLSKEQLDALAGRNRNKDKKDVTEMDKSQTPPGRDTGPRSGPDRVAKTITSKQMQDQALDKLKQVLSQPEHMDILKRLQTKEDVAEADLDKFKKYTRPVVKTEPKIERTTNPAGRTTDHVEWKVTTPTGEIHRYKSKKQAQEHFDSFGHQGVSEGKADYNFDIEDLKRLERIRDLPTLKTQAMMLISKPSAKPMRPEKVEWFKNALERMTSPMAVIKLMYDLLLSGEGYAVVGSKSSMNPNSYRQRFNEQDVTEDALAGMKRLAGIATVPAQTTPGLRQYRHMPTAVQPR